MKAIIKLLLIFLPVAGSFASTQDTVYVMHAGEVIYKRAVTDLDSISYQNWFTNRKSIIEKIATDPDYNIFYQGLVATGLVDSLKTDRDRSYNYRMYIPLIKATKELGRWYYEDVPHLKRSGFTLLLESDSVFNLSNIHSLSDLRLYAASIYNAVYAEDATVTDVKNRKNSLNRFIAYHIINKKLSLPMFIDAYDTDHMIKTRDMYEYLETMCPNTLMEIKKDRSTTTSNIINFIPATGSANHIIKNFAGPDVYNSYYYGIDKPLCYDINVRNELSGKRLRFDFASLFPELTNNAMRGKGVSTPDLQMIIPRDYLQRLTCSEQTQILYLTPYAKFQDYEGDEISITASAGRVYDFTITTPPVPAGTYEIRYGYQTNGKRGVAEMYIDNISVGAPVNLNMFATDMSIGYEIPGTVASDLSGYENDKAMRNHGYMKGPACFKVVTPGWTSGENARYSNSTIRKILGTFTFNSDSTHKLTVKGLSNGEFMCDYIEFVPVSALETEDIY